MYKESHKEIATTFLRLASSGKVSEAFSSYGAPNFRHHNPYFKGDAKSLAIGMQENAKENPDKVFEVQHIVEEQDLVAVHSRLRLKPNSFEVAVFHLFRFENDKIAELWDVGQQVPSDSINENGMF